MHVRGWWGKSLHVVIEVWELWQLCQRLVILFSYGQKLCHFFSPSCHIPWAQHPFDYSLMCIPTLCRVSYYYSGSLSDCVKPKKIECRDKVGNLEGMIDKCKWKKRLGKIGTLTHLVFPLVDAWEAIFNTTGGSPTTYNILGSYYTLVRTVRVGFPEGTMDQWRGIPSFYCVGNFKWFTWLWWMSEISV